MVKSFWFLALLSLIAYAQLSTPVALPRLVYSTYVGSGLASSVQRIVADPEGHVYLAGHSVTLCDFCNSDCWARPRRKTSRLTCSMPAASGSSIPTGRENRPSVSQLEGLRHAGRPRSGCPSRKGESGLLARIAILGEVHARHQGPDGQELHRQSAGRGAQGDARKGGTGDLALVCAARVQKCGRGLQQKKGQLDSRPIDLKTGSPGRIRTSLRLTLGKAKGNLFLSIPRAPARNGRARQFFQRYASDGF